MKSRIKAIAPEMVGNMQKSYNGSHGTMYTFLCTLENGTTGQVSSKSPTPHRFGVGDEVEFTFTPAANPAHTGRLKIEKPKDEVPPINGEAHSSNGQRGWSPQKEASVMIQGLLKSIIESGAPVEQWSALLNQAIGTHDTALGARSITHAMA